MISAFTDYVLYVPQWLGKLAVVAVPLLLVGTLILGTLAAATYNEGASQYIKPCAASAFLLHRNQTPALMDAGDLILITEEILSAVFNAADACHGLNQQILVQEICPGVWTMRNAPYVV